MQSNSCVNRWQNNSHAKEQLCGHIVCLATREHAIMEAIISMLSLLYDKDQLALWESREMAEE
jgi:hypothetical protein